jgi:ribosomal protein S1
MKTYNVNWELVKSKYPIDTIVQGKVTRVAPFGFFLEIGDDSVQGFVDIINFTDEEKIITKEMFPQIGTIVIGKILGYRDENLSSNQIGITTKHSEIITAINYT